MNDLDIQTLLHESPSPDMMLNPDAVTRGGRARVRRRRMTVAGACVAALAVVGVGTVGVIRHSAGPTPARTSMTSTTTVAGAPVRFVFGSALDSIKGDAMTFNNGMDSTTVHLSESASGLQLYSDSEGKRWTPLTVTGKFGAGTSYVDAYQTQIAVIKVPNNAVDASAVGAGAGPTFAVRMPSGATYAFFIGLGGTPRGVVWVDSSGRWSDSLGETAISVKPGSAQRVLVFPKLKTWVPQIVNGTGEAMDYTSNPTVLGASDGTASVQALLPKSAHSVSAKVVAPAKGTPTLVSAPVPGTDLVAYQASVSVGSASFNSLPISLSWVDQKGKHVSDN